MNETSAATVAAYLVSIIKYFHKNEIIIRNLRPETIYFEADDSLDIKLVDLSLAMEYRHYKDLDEDHLYEAYQILPPYFRAPELFQV